MGVASACLEKLQEKYLKGEEDLVSIPIILINHTKPQVSPF